METIIQAWLSVWLYVITAIGIVLGCIVLKIWGFKKPAGIAIMLFSFAEVAMHVAIGVQDMAIFGEYGINVVYSPGLITSLFGFLPVGVALAIELFRKAPRPTIIQWVMGVVAMFVFAFALISLPEMLLGQEDTPYKFTDRGYYEQYYEQFEIVNSYEY